MFRRLATLSLALSMSLGAFAPQADARGFAQRPVDDAVVVIGDPVAVEVVPEAIRKPMPRLSEQMRARLRKVLKKRRDRNVAAFRAYARRGVYPHNYLTTGELNVWTDGDGHMCAAATMIFRSGARALVRKVAKENNYIRLADVTDGPLMDWILTSGLTHPEIIAIQAPMVGMPERPDVFVPGTEDWRIAEDARLRARYDQVLALLAESRDASLEAAIDALALRPDLVAKLVG
jgi:hypothetical protein